MAADQEIEAATDQVRYLGQDSRFPMVANENAAYGLERNMWGFRWVGRNVALACLVAIVLAFVFRHTSLHVGASVQVGGLSPDYAIRVTLKGGMTRSVPVLVKHGEGAEQVED
ncbi:hypothetical protein ACTWQE_20320 [Streptomyces sp. 8N706]